MVIALSGILSMTVLFCRVNVKQDESTDSTLDRFYLPETAAAYQVQGPPGLGRFCGEALMKIRGTEVRPLQQHQGPTASNPSARPGGYHQNFAQIYVLTELFTCAPCGFCLRTISASSVIHLVTENLPRNIIGREVTLILDGTNTQRHKHTHKKIVTYNGRSESPPPPKETDQTFFHRAPTRGEKL